MVAWRWLGLLSLLCGFPALQINTASGGTNSAGGIFFEIEAINQVTIEALGTLFSVQGASASVQIYYRTSMTPTSNDGNWISLGTPTVTTSNVSPVRLSLSSDVIIPAGSTYGFHIFSDSSVKYTNGVNTWSDSNLIVITDATGCGASTVFSLSYCSRQFNGYVVYSTEAAKCSSIPAGTASGGAPYTSTCAAGEFEDGNVCTLSCGLGWAGSSTPVCSSGSWSSTSAPVCTPTTPALTGIVPRDGVSAVIVDSSVVVDFNVPMDRASVEAGLSVSSSGGPLAGSFLWSGDVRVSFTPVAQVQNTLYTVTISGAVAQNGATLEDFTSTFTTLAFVYYVYPHAEAEDISLNQFVMVVFREQMDTAVTTGKFSLQRKSDGMVVAGTTAWENGVVMLFTPDEDLLDTTQYEAVLAVGARSLAGVSLSNPLAWAFETEVVVPHVVSIEPADDTTRVPLSSSIVVTFSKPMATTSTCGAIVLAPPSTGEGTLVVQGSCVATSENTFRFTPHSPLLDKALYSLFVLNDARDITGNLLLDGANAKFETIDATSPSVVSITPNGTSGVGLDAVITIEFTEAMDTDLTENAINVLADGSNVAGFFTWQFSDTVAVFHPTLPDASIITIAVRSFATDVAGNAVEREETASFVTLATCSPACNTHGICVDRNLCGCLPGWGPYGLASRGGQDACNVALTSRNAMPGGVSIRDPPVHIVLEVSLVPPGALVCLFETATGIMQTGANKTSSTTVVCPSPPGVLTANVVSLSLGAEGLTFAPLPFAFDDCPENKYFVAPNDCLPCPSSFFRPLGRGSACLPCSNRTVADNDVSGCACVGADCDGAEAVLLAANENEGGSSTGLFVGILVALIVCFVLAVVAVVVATQRHAKKKTMRKYFIDDNATVRQGANANSMQQRVHEMLAKPNTSRLGQGQFADIFKCKFGDEWIVLKLLNNDMQNNLTAIREFDGEVAALSRVLPLNHPSIIRLEFFVPSNPKCIALELCVTSLREALEREDLTERAKMVVAAEVSSGLAALHSLSIAHNDIKTENILLTEDGRSKICDYGISRIFGESAHDNTAMTSMVMQDSVQMGIIAESMRGPVVASAFSPRYVDPSRLQGKCQSPGDHFAADMYSYGMLLWAMCAEEEPYSDRPAADVQAMLTEDPTMRPEVSEEWHDVFISTMKHCWQATYMRLKANQVFGIMNASLKSEFDVEIASEYAQGSLTSEPKLRRLSDEGTDDSYRNASTMNSMDPFMSVARPPAVDSSG